MRARSATAARCAASPAGMPGISAGRSSRPCACAGMAAGAKRVACGDREAEQVTRPSGSGRRGEYTRSCPALLQTKGASHLDCVPVAVHMCRAQLQVAHLRRCGRHKAGQVDNGEGGGPGCAGRRRAGTAKCIPHHPKPPAQACTEHTHPCRLTVGLKLVLPGRCAAGEAAWRAARRVVVWRGGVAGGPAAVSSWCASSSSSAARQGAAAGGSDCVMDPYEGASTAGGVDTGQGLRQSWGQRAVHAVLKACRGSLPVRCLRRAASRRRCSAHSRCLSAMLMPAVVGVAAGCRPCSAAGRQGSTRGWRPGRQAGTWQLLWHAPLLHRPGNPAAQRLP